MAISEKQRHDLFRRIEEALGNEHAATMMELLPPVGWADVATKRDIDALAVATKRDIDALAAGTKRDLDALAAGTKRDLDALAAGTKRDLDALAVSTKRDLDALEERLTLRMASKDDIAALRRDVTTWLFAGMGIQTAIVGLLVSLA